MSPHFAYSRDGREEAFYRHLPEHRRRRRPRDYKRHKRTHIFDTQSLSHRPERVAERAEFGHWECDLMMFRKEHGKTNVTSLVERVSRYTVDQADHRADRRRAMPPDPHCPSLSDLRPRVGVHRLAAAPSGRA